MEPGVRLIFKKKKKTLASDEPQIWLQALQQPDIP